MAKKKPLEYIFNPAEEISSNRKKTNKVEKARKQQNGIDEKKEIEAYIKKIKDKLKDDPAAQKKAAMIISLMLSDESEHKSRNKKAI